MKKILPILGLLISYPSFSGLAQTLPAFPSSPTSQPSLSQPTPPATWRVTKEKTFPLYKVQILTLDNSRAPLGIEGSRAVISDLKSKTLAEVKSLLVEPDPRETVRGWVAGTPLDLDKDGYEDLLLRSFTGGSHCCYSYQIYSLGKVLKKLGELKLKDSEQVMLKDLNEDGVYEILGDNPSFTYLKNLPYSGSPFPPEVFGMEKGKYSNQDSKYPAVFDEDIAKQKKLLEQGYSDTAAIQIVLDYLLSGRTDQAWHELDQNYKSTDKDARRQEIQERWEKFTGIASGPANTEIPSTKPIPGLLP